MKRLPILLTVVAALAAAGSARADKLVIFKNGKALKATSVVKDGLWLKCEFDKGNFISVKASAVESIEEAAVGSNEGELRTNKVAPGSGYQPPANFNPNEPSQHEMAQQQEVPPQPTDEG